MHNFKDPLLPHITDRNSIFQECHVYLPLDMTNGLIGYGGNTKCMKSSSKPSPWSTNTALSPSPSQALWPANLDTMLREPPQRFPGPQVCPRSKKHTLAHEAKANTLIGLEGFFRLFPPAVSRCQWHWFSALLCHSPGIENTTNISSMAQCNILRDKGKSGCLCCCLINNYLINRTTCQHTTDSTSVWIWGRGAGEEDVLDWKYEPLDMKSGRMWA